MSKKILSMNNNMKLTKKYNLNSIKIFLSEIKEKQFRPNKSLKGIPWKFLKLKKFNFYFLYVNNKIIGNITILNSVLNKHLYFLYVHKKYRRKGIGKFLLRRKFLKTKKLKTVHVLKSLKNTIKFYQKFNFVVSKKNEGKNVIKWVNKCTTYDNKTFKNKYLIIKDY